MNAPLPAEQKSVTLVTDAGDDVRFRIDIDGDLMIDDDALGLLYIKARDLPKLRDWLNKVLPP